VLWAATVKLARRARGGAREASERGDEGEQREARARASATRVELVTLAWPIAAAMLGESALGLVDTKLVGALGAEALAGVGTASVVLFLGYALAFGLMRGVKVRAAHAIGEGRAGDAVRYAQAGALAGVVFGVAVIAVMRAPEGLFRALGVAPATARAAAEFAAARAWGAPAMFVTSAMVQFRQAAGDTRATMVAGLLANGMNAALAYALIYGRFGLPALGVAGAGYATALTEWAQATGLVLYTARVVKREGEAAKLGLAAAAREVATLGLPTGAHFLAENLAFTTFTLVLGSMGAAEMAAHQLALNAIRASFLPGFAVSEAGCVLVGRALGRRDLAEADRVAAEALKLALAFMTLCGLGFLFAGGALARVFSADPRVIAVATKLLMVAALFQTLDAANMVLRGLLRGAKDVRFVALCGTTIAWLAIPGAAYLLGKKLGMGAVGGWWGFVLETALCAALFSYRWARGPWREAYRSSHRGDARAAEGVAPAV
jgi:MATE family multidrug resistance protein